MLRRKEKEEKKEIILIRCSGETKKRFKVFKATYDFKNLEQALRKLLDLAESHPELVTRRYV